MSHDDDSHNKTGAWDAEKRAIMERELGTNEKVLSSLIPWFMGGELSIFLHRREGGLVFATHELIEFGGNAPSNTVFRGYELALFRPQSDVADGDHKDEAAILQNIGRYATQTQLEPGQTIEFPEDFGSLSGRIFLLGTVVESDKFTSLEGGPYGVMAVVEVHREELKLAEEHGSGEIIIERLKKAGHWPWSSPTRPSVVNAE